MVANVYKVSLLFTKSKLMQRIEEERKIQTKTNIFISDCRLRPRDIETYNKLNNDHDDDDDDDDSTGRRLIFLVIYSIQTITTTAKNFLVKHIIMWWG